jgi:endonuclease YncB( thermonuclease family)
MPNLRRIAVVVLLGLAVSATRTAAFADQIAGRATVIDGDTIDIGGTRIRLFGIDAPETDQTCHGDDGSLYRCGQAASTALEKFLAHQVVTCTPSNLDFKGMTVAVCAVAGVDVGDWVVRSGLGLDWPAVSKGRYNEAQKAAERAGDGLWGGQWVTPWQYRDCRRAGGQAERCSEDATLIH